MVKVDEFDALDLGLGSLAVIDEEEGNGNYTSNDSTTTSTALEEEVGCGCDQTMTPSIEPPPPHCEFAATSFSRDESLQTGTDGAAGSPKDADRPMIAADVQRLFQRARQLRHHRYRARPYGILGLYQQLCDVRQDGDWAYAAALRRQQGKPYLAWIDHHELMLLQNHKHTRALRWFGCIMVVASTALLLASFAMDGWRVESMSVNSMVGPSAATLLRLGALQRSSIVSDNQWYRVVTAIPLHAGVIHWSLNGAALLWMGRSCLRPESSSDARRYVVVFLAAAVAGNLCSAAYSPFTVSMGASGGLFGWLGGCLADVVANFDQLSRSDDRYAFPRRTAIAWLVLEVLLLVGLGLTPYVDNFAHMGGFLTGMGIEWAYKSTSENTRRSVSSINRNGARPLMTPLNRLQRRWTVLLVMIVVMFHVGLVARSTSNEDVCKKCRYLSCVPFPFGTTNKWWRCDSCEQCSVRTTFESAAGPSWLDITCPYGDVVRRPYPEGLPRDAILSTLVPQTCRESCSL